MRPWQRHIASLLLPLVWSGCAGGQTGQEDKAQTPCETTVEPIAVDLDPDIGLAAQEIIDQLQKPHAQSLMWWRTGDSAEATLSLESVHGQMVVRRTGLGACADSLRLEAQMHFSTDDGQLDEDFEAVAEAFGPDELSVFGTLDPQELSGTWNADEHDIDLSSLEAPLLSLRLRLTDNALNGEVTLGGDPNPDDNRTLESAAIADLTAAGSSEQQSEPSEK